MAKKIDAFWDRWIVHGIEKEHIKLLRKKELNFEDWLNFWPKYGEEYKHKAEFHKEINENKQAEQFLRKASLYYYMNYWIYYKNVMEKKEAYIECIHLNKEADSLSPFITSYETLLASDFTCSGRIRRPKNIKGVILLINPVDSAKEELYQYETDFLNKGFATVCFDGPGQGETFAFLNIKGTNKNWQVYINSVIDFTRHKFPNEKIFLFGTSLGAAWALYGSSHPEVSKVVSVSPTSQYENMSLPSYFIERIEGSFINTEFERPVPNVLNMEYKSPVYIFYGNKDLMVPVEDIDHIYNNLPQGKKRMYFSEEGHCCNYRLEEIRLISADWFLQ